MFAAAAIITFDEAVRAQDDVGILDLGGLQLSLVRAALERAGVIFIAENGEGPGVRLRKVEP